jgi:hypothetical protein
MAPPAKSSESAADRLAWSAVEESLGVNLPDDYKQFIEAYGSGRINELIWILNPFSANENINLERQSHTQAKVLEELRAIGEDIPFNVFPTSGGLLPFGITDNGDVLYWITRGAPNDWIVVVNEARGSDWQIFEQNMTSFLASVLQHEIVCSVFPRNFPGPFPMFEPV